MAKLVEYDVTNVEESGGGTGVKVRPGLYCAEIVSAKVRDTKSNGDPANDIQVILNCGDDFDWVYSYVGLGPAADWKLAEFVRALALKEKGKFDPDKLKGKLIRIKINAGEYGGEYSPDAGKMFPAQKGDEIGAVSFSSQISENGDGPQADDPDPHAGTVGAADGQEIIDICREDPEDPEVGSYDDWPDEDIAAEVEARGLTMPGGRGTARNKGIKALRADDEAAAEPEAEPEAEAAADDDAASTDDDYDEWTLEDLQKEWDEREMGDLPDVKGRNREARLKTTIINELRKDDAENPFEG